MRFRPSLLLPGVLVAATGVGAGDLVSASLAGSELGLVILWAALAGALLKGVLTEGLARWQLATGTTLLEGWQQRLGGPLPTLFGLYLVLWSVVVGGALVSACGIAAAAFVPLGEPGSDTGRIVWGVVHAIVGVVVARVGGFRVFERAMAVCIAVMFVCVVTSAWLLVDDWGAVLRGTLVPTVPEGGLGWVFAVLGGVGGTVTVLSYGYWIREHGREGSTGLSICRVDLSVAYAMTALFGLAMIVIGSRLELSGSGAGVALAVADQLAAALGEPMRWLFLAGFWGAVFSSLLGVWQGVPYLFADWLALRRGRHVEPETLDDTAPYRWFQLGLALVPLPLLGTSFKGVQLAYAICGALFMPVLAATLLVMNNRTSWVSERFRNGWLANAGLALTVGFFAWAGGRKLLGLFD